MCFCVSSFSLSCLLLLFSIHINIILQVIYFMLIMILECIIIADDPFANGTNNQHRCSQKSLQENGPTSCDIAFCGTGDSVCCIAKHKPYRTKAAYYSCP